MENEGVLSPVVDIEISYKSLFDMGKLLKLKTWIEEYDGIRVVWLGYMRY